MIFKAFLLGPFCDSEIETWIIDVDDDIRLKVGDVFFTEFYILQNGTQMGDNFPKTHKSQHFVMLNQYPTHLLHQVTSPKADLGFVIFFLQGFHQF